MNTPLLIAALASPAAASAGILLALAVDAFVRWLI